MLGFLVKSSVKTFYLKIVKWVALSWYRKILVDTCMWSFFINNILCLLERAERGFSCILDMNVLSGVRGIIMFCLILSIYHVFKKFLRFYKSKFLNFHQNHLFLVFIGVLLVFFFIITSDWVLGYFVDYAANLNYACSLNGTDDVSNIMNKVEAKSSEVQATIADTSAAAYERSGRNYSQDISLTIIFTLLFWYWFSGQFKHPD